jgi:hypothetical protein
MTESRHMCIVENAPKFADWIATRGGIAVWQSVDLSDPSASWSTPALTDGKPTNKPTWKAESKPSRIITSTDDVLVAIDKELRRFHVAVRRSTQGFSFKCTDASSSKIKKAVELAGEGAYYEFDYSTQEAVIMIPVDVQTLTAWIQANKTV